jgi:hypothetical protein
MMKNTTRNDLLEEAIQIQGDRLMDDALALSNFIYEALAERLENLTDEELLEIVRSSTR